MSNLPESFKDRMKLLLNEDYNKFEEALLSKSQTSIRINSSKSKVQKIEFEIKDAIQWASDAYYLEERPLFTADPSFHAGAYYVQESSSMFLESAINQCFDNLSDIKVLDLCAAPGGKSTHLAGILSESSLLVSNEVIKSRVVILSENIQKWGSGNVVVTNNDPKDFNKIDNFFDCIVIDAPCSGEGMFRKDSNAIENWSDENVKLCALRQRRILSDVWSSLKPGGCLIYSTCTFSEEENEDNVNWLLSEFESESIKIKIGDWGVIETQKGNSYGYRFYPHKVPGEGFFLSVIKKKDADYTERKNKKKSKPSIVKLDKKQSIDYRKQIIGSEDWSFYSRNEMIFAVPINYDNEVEFLFDNLNVYYAGVELGMMLKKDFRPEHSLSLFKSFNIGDNLILDVNKDQALTYLRKDELNIDTDLPDGWIIIRYNGLSLGWVKKIGNRFNNYYPKEWRIRMSMDRLSILENE